MIGASKWLAERAAIQVTHNCPRRRARRSAAWQAVLIALGMALCVGRQAMAADVTRPAEFAIVGARIYTAPDAAPIEDGVVVVKNGRIAQVGTRSQVHLHPRIQVVDARGDVLTAGFWNCHIHLMTPEQMDAAKAPASKLEGGLQAMLTRWGFTSVFDLASSTDNTLALRQRVEDGEVAGPMILTVGDPFYPKDGTPIYVRDYLKAHGVMNEEVSSPEEAVARAKRQLDRGTDGVKLFAGAIVGGNIGVKVMRLDIAKAVVEEAHRRGRPAFAHPSNLAGMNVAIDSGVDVLAHTTAMDGGGVPGGWSPELIARMRAHNMALTPTMMLFEVEAKKSGESAEDLANVIEMITAEVKSYSTAGGEILFGTDVGYTDAYDTTEEYRLMSGALSWRQILATLTTAPARRFGFAARKGRVQKGMDADLVLLAGDPAQDPTAFAHIHETIRGGRVIWSDRPAS